MNKLSLGFAISICAIVLFFQNCTPQELSSNFKNEQALNNNSSLQGAADPTGNLKASILNVQEIKEGTSSTQVSGTCSYGNYRSAVIKWHFYQTSSCVNSCQPIIPPKAESSLTTVSCLGGSFSYKVNLNKFNISQSDGFKVQIELIPVDSSGEMLTKKSIIRTKYFSATNPTPTSNIKIITQPKSTSVNLNDPFDLRVTATSDYPIQYQWVKVADDGRETNVSGSGHNTNTLSVLKVNNSHIGNYRLRMESNGVRQSSNIASVTLIGGSTTPPSTGGGGDDGDGSANTSKTCGNGRIDPGELCDPLLLQHTGRDIVAYNSKTFAPIRATCTANCTQYGLSVPMVQADKAETYSFSDRDISMSNLVSYTNFYSGDGDGDYRHINKNSNRILNATCKGGLVIKKIDAGIHCKNAGGVPICAKYCITSGDYNCKNKGALGNKTTSCKLSCSKNFRYGNPGPLAFTCGRP